MDIHVANHSNVWHEYVVEDDAHIANAAGVTPAALYYHFADKDALYLEAVGGFFKRRIADLAAALSRGEDPWSRLESFVIAFTNQLAEDWHFQRLLQWALLDTDEGRLRALTGTVFDVILEDVQALASELGSAYDPHLLTVSILSLILLPFQAGVATRHLPSYREHHSRPAVLAKHIVRLLKYGLASDGDC